MLRQQAARTDSRPNRSLADFVAPAGDHLGAFAVCITGAEQLARRYEGEQDDYRAIMVKALADRLAEASAEYAHLEARRAWYEPDSAPTIEELHAERFRGIRPAFGYPACPDHSEKRKLVDLLDAERIGLGLTESFAMTPAASVSGLLFAHPSARYFAVGRIGRDQVEDYAARKGVTVGEAETWLRPNLSYEPEAPAAAGTPAVVAGDQAAAGQAGARSGWRRKPVDADREQVAVRGGVQHAARLMEVVGVVAQHGSRGGSGDGRADRGPRRHGQFRGGRPAGWCTGTRVTAAAGETVTGQTVTGRAVARRAVPPRRVIGPGVCVRLRRPGESRRRRPGRVAGGEPVPAGAEPFEQLSRPESRGRRFRQTG